MVSSHVLIIMLNVNDMLLIHCDCCMCDMLASVMYV